MAEIKKSRAVIDDGEIYKGDVIPDEKAEIDREVYLHDKSTVKGSVYGEEVEIKDSTVEEALMAKSTVELEKATIGSDVGTQSNLIAENSKIEGTLTCKKANIQESVVLGNIIADEVIIENTVVLGTVIGKNRLEIKDSTVSTFKCREKAVMNGAKLLIPQAVVHGKIEFEDPIQVTSIKTEDGYPELNEGDIYKKEGKNYLTLAPRIINLDEVLSQLKEIRKFIRGKVISDRLVKGNETENFDRELIKERLNNEVLEVQIKDN